MIEMRFAEGKSVPEITRELSRTDGAVKQLQFRAIQNLRARIEKKPRGKRAVGKAHG